MLWKQSTSAVRTEPPSSLPLSLHPVAHSFLAATLACHGACNTFSIGSFPPCCLIPRLLPATVVPVRARVSRPGAEALKCDTRRQPGRRVLFEGPCRIGIHDRECRTRLAGHTITAYSCRTHQRAGCKDLGISGLSFAVTPRVAVQKARFAPFPRRHRTTRLNKSNCHISQQSWGAASTRGLRASRLTRGLRLRTITTPEKLCARRCSCFD